MPRDNFPGFNRGQIKGWHDISIPSWSGIVSIEDNNVFYKKLQNCYHKIKTECQKYTCSANEKKYLYIDES